MADVQQPNDGLPDLTPPTFYDPETQRAFQDSEAAHYAAPVQQPNENPSAPSWKPHSWRLGPFLFAATRAVSGEWTTQGKVRQLYLQLRTRGWGFHLIVGPWCFSVGRMKGAANA